MCGEGGCGIISGLLCHGASKAAYEELLRVTECLKLLFHSAISAAAQLSKISFFSEERLVVKLIFF